LKRKGEVRKIRGKRVLSMDKSEPDRDRESLLKEKEPRRSSRLEKLSESGTNEIQSSGKA